MWDLFVVLRMREVIAGSWPKPYRQMKDFLVGLLAQALSWFVRQ